MALPPSRTQDQFVLRLPDGLRDRIADVAKSNNRSMNSEIVAILEERLVPSLATRLRSLINQLNQAHFGEEYTPSRLAEEIGEGDASSVEAAFEGKAPLSFKQMEIIAERWGVRSRWLKHGAGEMFAVSDHRNFITEDAHRLLNSNNNRILFVRSKSKSGELAFIVDHGNGLYECFSTSMHISDNIGAGGEADDVYFSNACRYLCKMYRGRVAGYLIDEQTFSMMVSGQIYAGAILYRRAPSSWIEEWWDESKFSGEFSDEFWDGYRAFCERISQGVQRDERARAERDLIDEFKWKPREGLA
jgi:hypothetical protein